MILDSSTKLEAVLAGAITTSQPEAHVFYVDWNIQGLTSPPVAFRVALNGSSDVTLLAAPTASPAREVQSLTIYNKDTVSVTVTVKTDDSTTERIIQKQTLATTETFCYEKGVGWYVIGSDTGRLLR